MRVRVYVDGFNLYHGGKKHAEAHGRSASWKWLDVRSLTEIVVARRWPGQGGVVDHVTYLLHRPNQQPAGVTAAAGRLHRGATEIGYR